LFEVKFGANSGYYQQNSLYKKKTSRNQGWIPLVFEPLDYEQFPIWRGPKFLKSRDADRKFQSSESLSHLIAGVFILQEPKTAENRKLFSENDETQTQ
jgi:hypothetical protein